MHTSKDDYLINTLRFVSAKEATQIYGAILPESLTSLEIKETKTYQIYLGFATGATLPKKERKFKKPASPKLIIVPVSTEEPTRKSKRVKRPAKKSTQALARGVVIRETLEMLVSKKKEKVDVARAESWRNDEDDSNNEQESRSEDNDQEKDSDDDKTQSDNKDESESKHEIKENASESESDDQEEDEEKIEDDEEEKKDGLVKTPFDNSDDEDETTITDKAEVDTDKGFVQEEGTEAAMTNVQQGNENSEISQVIEDAYVTLFTVPQKTEVLTPILLTVPVLVIFDSSPVFSTVIPQSLQSFTPLPLLSTPIPSPTTEPTNPPSILPDFVSVFQFNNRVITLEKEVAELKMDPLHTYVTTLVDDHLDTRLGLKKSYDIDMTIFSTYGKVYSLKRSRRDKDEDPFAGSDQGLKKRKTGKDATPATCPKAKESQSGSSKDLDMPQDQEDNLGKDDEEPKEKLHLNVTGQNQSWLMTLASSAEKPSKTFDELMSTPIDFSVFIMNGLKINNLTQETLLRPAFRLLKSTYSNYAELEYDFEECYKALSEKLD
ncbi:hypothetical protein Tco_0525857 [Tanacetum coccineum]